MKYSFLSLKIKKYRQQVGFTQEDLAHKTGVSIGTIKSYETGNRIPSPKMKKELCTLFNITLEDLEEEFEKDEIKKYMTSLFNTYKISDKEFKEIKRVISNFWEKCFSICERNRVYTITNALDYFTIEHKKTSAEYVKVNRKMLNTFHKDFNILCISEDIINNIIKFFYDFYMCGIYKEII